MNKLLKNPPIGFLEDFQLPTGKKAYFASDFHLGAPTLAKSAEREKALVRWLDQISADAGIIFLVGDIFDFWYEYAWAVPKGGVRLLGKLAALSDAGVPLVLFTGNHDMWMFGYLSYELKAPVFHKPITIQINGQKIYIGHGDGLGPGDKTYKLLKKLVFQNPLTVWLFKQMHPDWGIGLATAWSQHSRLTNEKVDDKKFLGNDEWLWAYSQQVEQTQHHDFYIFGHRHLPLDLKVGHSSRYINLGEWINFRTYAVLEGQDLHLKAFENETWQHVEVPEAARV